MGKIFPLAVIFFGIAATFVACGRAPEKLVVEPDSETASTGKPNLADLAQELKDIKYTQSKDGKTEWELQAQGVQQALDGPTELQRVQITYYADDARVTVVTAETGIYETKTHDAELRGNVVVTTSDGATFSTDSLKWDQANGLLSGQGEVRITRGGSTILGKGFQLAPDAESVTLFQVEGVIRQGEMKL
jgi:LPS export ABC transporter protein LptC